MKIITCFTVECCNKQKEFNSEYDALNYLYNHIRRFHKPLFLRLERRGMILARSQNGCGYFDSKGEGWRKAKRENIDFVNAWIMEALKTHLRGV